MAANILAIAEQRNGELRSISNEVVTAARDVADALGGEVHALLLGGPGVGAAAAELGRHGADRVFVGEHEALAQYSAPGYTTAISDQASAGDYFAVFFGASSAGKDLSPRVAARLDVPLATEATELGVDGGELVVTRPIYAGKVFAQLTLEGEPRVVSLRPNVFRAEERPRDGAVEALAVSPDPSAWRTRVREVKASAGGTVDVTEAPIVVSGGRGLKGPENWTMLEELAGALGDNVALGASRAVVDAGWRPHSEQVGQTGKTVSPQLYIAIGISGAIQHLAGMRTAKTIVAINKDPDAPIFGVADYGIVGDAFEVVPKLTEAIRNG
jgi:electron transfer flavoprotein alpha subunit